MDLYSLSDTDLLAECCWREASGEGPQGMLGVACQIWNRHIQWNKTLQHVILDKNQYSSMSEKNPRQHLPEYPMWQAAQEIAKRVNTGNEPDITKGALYYANLDTIRAENVKRGFPAESGWFFENVANCPDKHPITVVILHHTFFK